MKKRYLLLTVCLCLVLSNQVLSVPKNVIIIRHAEKVLGQNHLNLQGFERAGALPYYFADNPLYNAPPISYVFASALGKADSSVRPIQTCTPVANYYKLPLNIDFHVEQTKDLAQELLTNPKYEGSTVLICWSHGQIRSIVMALGAEDPGKWENNIFDQVYLITFENGQKPYLQKILQKLMFGDRATFQDTPSSLPLTTKTQCDENHDS